MDFRKARSTCWSLTCNLQSVSRATVDHCVEMARSLGWGVEGQLERGGEGGNLHYQFMLKTPQVRFSQVKKVFPTAHIEPAHHPKELKDYVHKEETRVEEFKKVEMSFMTYPMVRKQFFSWLLDTYDVEVDFFNPDDRLKAWDEFIGLSIQEGMECDLIGMNPQNRGCINKYWTSYIARESSSRQTEDRRQDRQTDTQEVSLPVYTQQDGVYPA